MCGIVGLFASRRTEPRSAALVAMLVQMADRGPDSAGVAVYRDPAADRVEQADALLRRAAPTGRLSAASSPRPSAAARSRDPREPRRRPGRGRRRRGRGVGAADAPRAARDERGPHDRDLQGDRPPRGLRRGASRSATSRHARARPYAHGDREPGDDRGLAPLLDRARPLPRPQRLALEPQSPSRASSAARGSTSRPRTTPRSRPATSHGACAKAPRWSRRSKAASTISTASTPSSSARSDGFAVLRDPIACKPAVLAETDDWVAMASECRAISVLPGASRGSDLGAGAGDRLRLGATDGLSTAAEATGRGRRPRGDARARAEPAAPRRSRRDAGPAAGAS